MYGQPMNGQATMIQMNAMMGGMGMGMGMMNPSVFMFSGNSLSLQSRLDSLTDADCERFIDANVTTSGVEVQAMSMMSLMCTMIWGSLLIFPLCFMCCSWWKRCTYPAFTISAGVYMSLGRLFRAPNLKNITINVVDNNFDEAKARILCSMLSESRVRGFTFINGAGDYNFLSNEYSNFVSNMRPIKTLSNVTSDIRWGTEIVNY
jgi:hypothetical protein